MTLDARAWLTLVVVAGIMGVLLFVTAGTTRYWQAWGYVSIFLGASMLATLYLMRHDRALLARRMRGGPMFEKEGAQRIVMVFTSLGSAALTPFLLWRLLDEERVLTQELPGYAEYRGGSAVAWWRGYVGQRGDLRKRRS
jgi:hypothetical protein